jgi:hypothetical protein
MMGALPRRRRQPYRLFSLFTCALRPAVALAPFTVGAHDNVPLAPPARKPSPGLYRRTHAAPRSAVFWTTALDSAMATYGASLLPPRSPARLGVPPGPSPFLAPQLHAVPPLRPRSRPLPADSTPRSGSPQPPVDHDRATVARSAPAAPDHDHAAKWIRSRAPLKRLTGRPIRGGVQP